MVPRTTMQAVSPLQRHSEPTQGNCSSKLQASAGTQTGTRGGSALVVSEGALRSGRSEQNVPDLHCVSWAQQYGKQRPASFSVTQAKAGAQSAAEKQGALTPPVPAGTHWRKSWLLGRVTWQL